MEINELIENIIKRFKTEEYRSNDYNLPILYSNKNEENLCRLILKEEIQKFVENLNIDTIEYKNKCEIYEIIISHSNFKMATEKINNRKKNEVEKDGK